MNSKLLTLFLIFLALFTTALLTRRGELLWLAVPFLIYMTTGWFMFSIIESPKLQAQRKIQRICSKNQTIISVEVAVRNQGGRVPFMQVVDSPLAGVIEITRALGMRTTLQKGGEDLLKYSFLEKRGRYAWKTIRVKVGDPLCLMTADLTLPAAAELSVQPERDNFRRLPLRASSTFHAPGSIPARLAGSGTDFWGVRPYHPGDSIRWLDWRLNARHPGTYFTKEFEQEEAVDIGLILDARSETDLQVGGDSLFEYSVRAAASLADGFIHQGNRVSLLSFGTTIFRVFPGYGKHQLNHILRCLSGIRSSSNGRTIGLHYIPLQMFSNRALLVVISPLSRADGLFFLRLRAAGYPCMLISPNPLDFVSPVLSKDPDSQRAFCLARQERRIQLESISRRNIRVIDWRVSQPLYPLLQSSLGHIRGQGKK